MVKIYNYIYKHNHKKCLLRTTKMIKFYIWTKGTKEKKSYN